MFLVATRLILHILILLPTLSKGTKRPQTTQKYKPESNLVDWELASSLDFLFANFHLIDKNLLNEHDTSTKKPTTVVATKSTSSPKPKNCGAKVTALTNIEFDSPTVHLQYWLLKPKLHLLRTFSGISADEFGPYREVVMRKDRMMVISYEFPDAKESDCQRLVEFSRKIVGYGRGEIPKIVVKCDCEKTFYFKLA